MDCDQKIRNLISLNMQGVTDSGEERVIRDQCKKQFCDFLHDGLQVVTKDLQAPTPNLVNISVMGRVTGTFVDKANLNASFLNMGNKIQTFCGNVPLK